MTEPSRFSFFIDNEVMDYRANIPKWKNPINDNTLSRAYLEEIKSLQDCILEQKFYVDILESMCKLHNMDLILTSWNYSYTDFYKIHKKNSCFHAPKCFCTYFM